MLKAGLGISTLLSPLAAAREATSAALSALGARSPTAALMIASAAHGRGLRPLAEAVADLVGPSRLVGASVEGVVARGVEVTDNPIVSVLAVDGIEVLPFLLEDLTGREQDAGGDIAALIGPALTPGDSALAPGDLVAFFADPLALRHAPLLAGLTSHLAPATVIGSVAAAPAGGRALLWHGGEAAPGSVAGLVLRAETPARLELMHSSHPIGDMMTVSRARGSWIVGLDGAQALEVHDRASREVGAPFRLDARRGSGPTDRGHGSRASSPLLLGIERADAPTGAAAGISNLRVRNIVGFDAARGAFSVPEPVPAGTRVAFLRLDPTKAGDALARQLAGLGDPLPRLGLYFNCRERGAALFGKPGVEATHLANAFADLPIAGAVGACQFARAYPGGPLELLTYTGALALIDR